MLVSLGGKGMRWYRGPRAPYQNGQETEENIEKAFLELIREKDIDDITISDIARKACIERSTFYRHSLSIDDLVTTLAQEMIWEMRAAIQKTGKSAIAAFPYVVWWLLFGSGEISQLESGGNSQSQPNRNRQQPRFVYQIFTVWAFRRNPEPSLGWFAGQRFPASCPGNSRL